MLLGIVKCIVKLRRINIIDNNLELIHLYSIIITNVSSFFKIKFVLYNFSPQTKTSSKKIHLNIPKTNSVGKLCMQVCNFIIVFFGISYHLFSKNYEFYQHFQETEAIEQTAEELSYASFPCGHCEYAATDGASLKKHIEAKH